MKISILIISAVFLFSCRTGSIKEKKAEFTDSRIGFHMGDVSRTSSYHKGKRRYFPKDKSKDFFVQEVVAVNNSSEELQIPFFLFSVSDVKPDKKTLSKQTSENKDHENKQPETDEKNPLTSRASAVLSCCGLWESFLSEMKFSSTFTVPVVKPGESVSRSLYFIYPEDKSPKYIQFIYSVKDSKGLIYADPVEIKSKD